MDNKIFFHDDDYYYELVRINIRKYRKFADITQEELAERVGYNTDFIGKIESPKMKKHFSLAVIGRIADALFIDIRYLLAPEDENLIIEVNNKKQDIMIHDDNYYYEIARRNIIKYRNLKNLTQANLANRLGRRTEFIGKIESDKVRRHFYFNTLGRIADALEIDIRSLFDTDI